MADISHAPCALRKSVTKIISELKKSSLNMETDLYSIVPTSHIALFAVSVYLLITAIAEVPDCLLDDPYAKIAF